MTPHEFNALPLSEQLKQLEPGDELHLRGGGWLPFDRYGGGANFLIHTHCISWFTDTGYVDHISLNTSTMDIIRAVRPVPQGEIAQAETVRGVPEFVKPLEHINPPDNEILALAQNLNNLLTADAQNNTDRHIINKMIKYLAIHFAYEARHD